jgi:FtsH-binding integral membrane protein
MEPHKSLLKEFLTTGWIITLLGAGIMLVRLLTDDKKTTFFYQLKRVVASACGTSFAWYIFEQTDVNSFYKAITYGVVGLITPEIVNGVVTLGKKFERNPEKFIKK